MCSLAFTLIFLVEYFTTLINAFSVGFVKQTCTHWVMDESQVNSSEQQKPPWSPKNITKMEQVGTSSGENVVGGIIGVLRGAGTAAVYRVLKISNYLFTSGFLK